MKTKVSYLTVNIRFIEGLDFYGLWIAPHTRDVEEYDFEWGKSPLNNPNEGYILVKEGLTGYFLVDTIQHELNHCGWWLYDPSGEESTVRVCSSVWNEALSRSKALRQLVQENMA